MSNDAPSSGGANPPESPPDPAKDSEAAWDRYINQGAPNPAGPAISADTPEGSAETPAAPAPDHVLPDISDSEPESDGAPAPPGREPETAPEPNLGAGPEPAMGPDLDDDPGYLIAGEDDDEILDPIQIKLDEIHDVVDGLRRDFEFKLKNDAQKNKIIDGLHTELQAYKNDIVKSHLRSLVMDVIQFIDNTRKLTQHYATRSPSEADPVKLLNLLNGIPSELEDLLNRQGVSPFTCPDRTFDPGRQRAIKRIPTPEENQDKTVAETVHPGYEWDGQVIRPEMVKVHVFQPAPAAPEPQEGIPDE
jgi:molecular chaperone GrpE (heat shock protein)